MWTAVEELWVLGVFDDWGLKPEHGPVLGPWDCQCWSLRAWLEMGICSIRKPLDWQGLIDIQRAWLFSWSTEQNHLAFPYQTTAHNAGNLWLAHQTTNCRQQPWGHRSLGVGWLMFCPMPSSWSKMPLGWLKSQYVKRLVYFSSTFQGRWISSLEECWRWGDGYVHSDWEGQSSVPHSTTMFTGSFWASHCLSA